MSTISNLDRLQDYFNFVRAFALILASSDEEMLPARSERVAPEIASLAWTGSEIGNRLPGAAKSLLGMLLREEADSFGIGAAPIQVVDHFLKGNRIVFC